MRKTWSRVIFPHSLVGGKITLPNTATEGGSVMDYEDAIEGYEHCHFCGDAFERDEVSKRADGWLDTTKTGHRICYRCIRIRKEDE